MNIFHRFVAYIALDLLIASSEVSFVNVGGDTGFDPNNLTSLEIGDWVHFHLYGAQGYQLIESTFEKPCEPRAGGYSMIISSDLQITQKTPTYYFSRWPNSGPSNCSNGLVFASNPEDMNAFIYNALHSTDGSLGGLPPTSIDTTATVSSSTTTSPVPSPSIGTDGVGVVTIIGSNSAETITYTSYPGFAAPTSKASTDHLVEVSAAYQLSFVPSHLTAQVGDTITFQFARGNHSVVRSTFEDPCQSLTSIGQTGFDSGFPLADGSLSVINYTIKINDTNPIFAFCSQMVPKDHCRAGHVFAANTIESGPQNYTAFQSRALQLAQAVSSNQTNGHHSSIHSSRFSPALFAIVATAAMYVTTNA